MSVRSLTRVYENRWPAAPAGVIRLSGSASKLQEGALCIIPVLASEDSCFGAEVSGIDWSRPVPEEIVDEVHSLRIPRTHLIY